MCSTYPNCKVNLSPDLSPVYCNVIVVQMEEVYFSNQDDIEVTMGNGSRQIVFDRSEATWLRTMDCRASSENSMDRQIYWITRKTDSTLSGSIKRGFPDSNTMETVREVLVVVHWYNAVI